MQVPEGSPPEDKKRTGVVVGASLASGTALIFMIALLMYVHKSRKQKRDAKRLEARPLQAGTQQYLKAPDTFSAPNPSAAGGSDLRGYHLSHAQATSVGGQDNTASPAAPPVPLMHQSASKHHTSTSQGDVFKHTISQFERCDAKAVWNDTDN